MGIKIVRSDEKYVAYEVNLGDPAEWITEAEHRPDLVQRLLVMIAEYEEQEVAFALGCAMLAQEGRRRGTFKLL